MVILLTPAMHSYYVVMSLRGILYGH